jgi:hypothetical protein
MIHVRNYYNWSYDIELESFLQLNYSSYKIIRYFIDNLRLNYILFKKILLLSTKVWQLNDIELFYFFNLTCTGLVHPATWSSLGPVYLHLPASHQTWISSWYKDGSDWLYQTDVHTSPPFCVHRIQDSLG